MPKLRKPISLQSKKAKTLSLSRTKSCLTEKLSLQTPIFFRDSESCMWHLQLGTKVNPDSVQAMEQKIVQRCETKVDADACKSSYLLWCTLFLFFISTNCFFSFILCIMYSRRSTFTISFKCVDFVL